MVELAFGGGATKEVSQRVYAHHAKAAHGFTRKSYERCCLAIFSAVVLASTESVRKQMTDYRLKDELGSL